MQNLARMGHCAPTVVQTLLDVSDGEETWLVKLAAGLPGGIGNTGAECGGMTGPLLLLGLRHATDAPYEGLPATIYLGHDFVARFGQCNGTLLCREIRDDRRLPIRCIRVIRDAPGLCADTLCSNWAGAVVGEKREAFRRLHAYDVEQGFHCCHAVLTRLRETIPVTQELLDATSPFVGGTVFMGMTCSAFTAGVMALGTAIGRSENSRLRVLRMIGMMILGGDAFADEVNEFNRTVNAGQRLAEWFRKEFGSTQCREIVKNDFSTQAGVSSYIESNHVARCRDISDRVSQRVREMIREGTARGEP